MRVFVAIFPPLEIRVAAAAEARETVRPLSNHSAGGIRWAKPENIHLTLKFLGDVREEVLGDLRPILSETCTRHAPFDVGLAGLGAFPSARHARILWAGVSTGSERLRALAADLDAALVPLGFEREERPYAPHLTLGRVRGRPASLDLSPAAGNLEFRAQRVELTESTLTPEGAIYRTIGTFALRKRS